jgi:ribonuclease Z
MIDLTLLGTSALMPLPERALTAATLTCAGRTILFDCGEGTQTAARKAHVSLAKVDVIALTHYHGDHIFGLPGLLQTLLCLGRTEPLYLMGPPGLRQAMAPILTLAGPLSYEVRLLEPEGQSVSLADLHPNWPQGATLTPVATRHRVVSQGYVFTLLRAGKFQPQRAKALGVPLPCWSQLQRGQPVTVNGITVTPEQVLGPARPGLKVVFSGDTTPCPALEEAAQGADLLLCEGTYGLVEQAQLAADHGHMTFAQAGQLAAKAQVKGLWLMHYSQMIQQPEDCLANAQAWFPEAVCGQDGMRTTLRFAPEGKE